MAWENRKGTSYYYRKRRIGRRVVSEYIGAGFLANLESTMAAQLRQQATAGRQARQELESEGRELDRRLDTIESYSDALVKALALLGGYRPHKGQWRKKRDAT